MIKVSIPFEHLASKNEKFNVWRGRPRLSDKYKDGKEAINKIAKKEIPKKHKPYDEPVMIEMVFHMPNKIRRDILNYTQQICDGLEGAVYTNDCHIAHAIIIRDKVSKSNPRVDITVLPTDDKQ